MKKAVRIEKLGGEGVGIGHIDGKVVFVPYSVPGDEVLVKLVHETNSYYKAEIVEIIKASRDRIEAPCQYFGVCGGCSHQNIKYGAQLRYKQELLNEIFRKFVNGGVKIDEITPSPEQFGYRNKLQMQCAASRGGKIGAGFYKIRSHEVVEIDNCPLHSEPLNKLVQSTVSTLNQFKILPYSEKLRKGTMRHIVVRESRHNGDMTMTFVANHETLLNQTKISKALFSKNKSLKGLYIYHNPHDTNVIFEDSEGIRLNDNRSPLRKIFGEDYISDNINGTYFKISPLSFFQVNTAQAKNMAKFIEENIGFNNKKSSLIDAYSGIGTLSLGLSHKFENVLAIEIVAQACALARINARAAGAKNYHVRRGDAAEIINSSLSSLKAGDFEDKYRSIILDPPRAGIDENMRDFLCEVKIPEILYISCNPHTQERDVSHLCAKGGYKIAKIAPFDMFPQTFHIENIIKLVQ